MCVCVCKCVCMCVCVRERDEFLVKVSVHAGLEMVPRHAAALGMKFGDQKLLDQTFPNLFFFLLKKVRKRITLRAKL